MAFSPDGKLLATAGGDGTVRLWNPVTGQPAGAPLQTGSAPGRRVGVAFSPDGKLLATADGDGTVRLWNPVTGQPVGAPLHAGPERGSVGVDGVAFSPDGKLLASAGGDGTVRLWNPVTGQPAGAPLPAEPGAYAGVYGVAFSPDGKLLASAGGDGTRAVVEPGHRPARRRAPRHRLAVRRVRGGVQPRRQAAGQRRRRRHRAVVEDMVADPSYAALCADVGPPTQQDWAKYASGEPKPRICA